MKPLSVIFRPVVTRAPELARQAESPHAALWRELMPGYAYFEQHRARPPGRSKAHYWSARPVR